MVLCTGLLVLSEESKKQLNFCSMIFLQLFGGSSTVCKYLVSCVYLCPTTLRWYAIYTTRRVALWQPVMELKNVLAWMEWFFLCEYMTGVVCVCVRVYIRRRDTSIMCDFVCFVVVGLYGHYCVVCYKVLGRDSQQSILVKNNLSCSLKSGLSCFFCKHLQKLQFVFV